MEFYEGISSVQKRWPKFCSVYNHQTPRTSFTIPIRTPNSMDTSTSWRKVRQSWRDDEVLDGHPIPENQPDFNETYATALGDTLDDDRATNLDQDIKERTRLKEEFQKSAENFEDLSARVKQLEKQVKELQKQVKQMERTQDSHGTRITALEATSASGLASKAFSWVTSWF